MARTWIIGFEEFESFNFFTDTSGEKNVHAYKKRKLPTYTKKIPTTTKNQNLHRWINVHYLNKALHYSYILSNVAG